MSQSVELWLVRHGETKWSLSGAHTSRTDVPLTERGRQRAEGLRDLLAGKHFDAVFTSPMQRARETCAIAGYAEGARIEPSLCEWNYGVYEGRTTKEIREQEPGWSVWTSEIRGGESLEAVGERADRVIRLAVEAAALNAKPDAQAPCVALFAHAHILRILGARWIGLAPYGGSLFALGTGSISILGWERETRVLESWNRNSSS